MKIIERAPSLREAALMAHGTHRHYIALDLMRGIAALAVVLYHLSDRLEMPWLAAHGYLAVDLFFIMSGFVLMEAYGERLLDGNMPASRFFVVRAVRILPLVILSTVFAYLLEIERPHILNPALHSWEALASLVLNSFLIPTPFSSTMHSTIFPLNSALWSLFFESVVNMALPFWISLTYRFWWLRIAMIISAILMIKGSIIFGTTQLGFDWANFYFGFPRVVLSFGFGILLCHHRHLLPICPIWVPVVAISCVFLVGPLEACTAVFDCICLFVVLPYITALAIGGHSGCTLRKISSFLGNISYPIYAIHAPILRIVATLTAFYHLSIIIKASIIFVFVIFIMILATIIYSKIDVPIRRVMLRIL